MPTQGGVLGGEAVCGVCSLFLALSVPPDFPLMNWAKGSASGFLPPLGGEITGALGLGGQETVL